MQRSLITAGLLSAFAITAHAQSSVTLYGSLDSGLVYSNSQGGHSSWQQGSGSLSNTCFGPRGSEEGERLQRLGQAEAAHRVAARRFPGCASDDAGACSVYCPGRRATPRNRAACTVASSRSIALFASASRFARASPSHA
ncbi:hypothetical protein QFZ89_004818 [Paraburkholderia youngii]